MDRQHPRDLFDVMHLFANEGITTDIRRAFVVYLASHPRPVHEVLFPKPKDITYEFERNFNGMTAEPVSMEALVIARQRMFEELQSGLDADERRFLLSLVSGETECQSLGMPHVMELPGIRWKLHNLTQLKLKNPKKFSDQVDALKSGLNL